MAPQIEISEPENQEEFFTVTLKGRIDFKGVAGLWNRAETIVATGKADNLRLLLDRVDYLDSAGAALISHMETVWRSRGKGRFQLVGLKDDFSELLQASQANETAGFRSDGPDKKLSFIENQGSRFFDYITELYDFIAFSGQIAAALFYSFLHPREIRWKDAFVSAERAGVNALPIVSLISFIVGLVMAFQAAMPMKMFGAELYVANLIGIAMVRELGPLMTAIILAGRSGSSFAAEIGTMKINEEIDALTTMGLDPVRFLMVPRVLAAVFITPLLTIFSNIVGVLGGSVVLLSMGFPAVAYYNQILSFVTWIDFTGGLVKCFVFGVLIAATGCIRGFQTKSGPSAVGISTTRAVVTGIILIAVFDGIFSVLYYCLGI